MNHVRDFRLFSVQVVAFTPVRDAQDFKTGRVAGAILPDFSSRYDGEMRVQPVEKGPLTIPAGQVVGISFKKPHVTFQSESSQWKFEATPDRTDSSWLAQDGVDETRSLTDICNACLEPIIQYPVNAEIQVGRLALVIQRWAPSETDAPGTTLAENFCKPELTNPGSSDSPFRNSKNFQIHNLKKYPSALEGVNVNSWVRCYVKSIDEQDRIVIEQDINTFSEEAEQQAFNEDDVRQFVEWARNDTQHILDLYFPSE